MLYILKVKKYNRFELQTGLWVSDKWFLNSSISSIERITQGRNRLQFRRLFEVL